MALSDYQKQLSRIKNGQEPKTTGPKPKRPIPKQSEKKKKELAAEKERGGDSEMDLFFQSLRKGMKNKCLFCGGPTMKADDEKFHFSLAHLMPKAIFKSVATHPDVIIELCFYGNSCHTNFDNGKITWEVIKDSAEWNQIKEQLLTILPLVAEEDRKHKLYSKLNNLVYGK